jgi:hypothetical protein
MIEKNLIDGMVMTSREVIGESIQVGERILTPTLEIKTYSKQFTINNHSEDPIFIGLMVSPTSLKITEGKQEWTIQIQEVVLKRS